MTEADTTWSMTFFALLAEGALWGVPRSGLLFQKQGHELVLVERMPWSDEIGDAYEHGKDVPPTKAALVAYQDADFNLIRDRFGNAHITVRKGERC